jgi:hypothetical protein
MVLTIEDKLGMVDATTLKDAHFCLLRFASGDRNPATLQVRLNVLGIIPDFAP